MCMHGSAARWFSTLRLFLPTSCLSLGVRKDLLVPSYFLRQSGLSRALHEPLDRPRQLVCNLPVQLSADACHLAVGCTERLGRCGHVKLLLFIIWHATGTKRTAGAWYVVWCATSASLVSLRGKGRWGTVFRGKVLGL